MVVVKLESDRPSPPVPVGDLCDQCWCGAAAADGDVESVILIEVWAIVVVLVLSISACASCVL